MRLEGLNDMTKQLGDLPDRVQRRVLQQAVTAGLREAAKDIRRAAPRGQEPSNMSAQYGRLRRNIRVKRLKPRGKAERAAMIHTGDAFWGWMIEKGTRYISAKPWFKPAFDAAQQRVIDAFSKRLGEGIEREAQKKP